MKNQQQQKKPNPKQQKTKKPHKYQLKEDQKKSTLNKRCKIIFVRFSEVED